MDSQENRRLQIQTQIHSNVALFETRMGNYYLPTDVPTDIIVNEMQRGRVFEPKILKIAKKYITKGTAVLDVGANFGQMTLLFAEFVGGQGHVFSFEADDFIFEVLKMNLAAHGRNNVTPICKAVYHSSGQVMFYPVPDFQRFGSYGSYGLDPSAKDGRKVETITIDSLNIQAPISFMKVDVQGSDLFVLQGSVETIKRNKMPIIFEYEALFQDEFKTSLKDYMQFVDSIDYKVKKVIYGVNYLIVPK
ncbi:MAG TPA: FkbM family methyltransferase [Pyrinomonadaceae bacterium]|nr:FkbM family methyltransferase [Pyrinomonadaceae bacterium]